MPQPAPRPTDDAIDVFALTHRGRVREHNEDNYLVCSLHKEIRVHSTSLAKVSALEELPVRLGALAVVADGLGGLSRGEEASQIAVDTIASYALYCVDCYHHGDPREETRFQQHLHDAAVRCHEAVRAKARQRPGGTPMATTMTLLVTHWPRMYVVQIGDSRCYVLHRGELRRLTRDQTLAQSLVDEGALPADQAARSRFANVLSSAIGSDALHPVTRAFTFEPEDVILLCTDGLTKHVEDDEIREHLAALETAEKTTRDLVDLALERGGSDNITVVVGCLKRG